MAKTDEKTLRGQLKASGLDAQIVDRLVKSEIQAGNCTPASGGFTVQLPLDDLIAASQSLNAAGAVAPPEVETSDALRKSGAMVGTELAEIVRANAANVESLLEYQNEMSPALVKGVHAQGVLMERMVDVLGSMANELDSLRKSVERVGGTPGTPRGRPAPHPNDDAGNKPSGNGPLKAPPRDVLRKSLIEEQNRLIKSDGDSKTILRVGQAVSALENSAKSVEQIMREFDITIDG